ncbi:MAG: hypothetical protein LBW85_13670 [Deltaproteobacteria bacterium]|jgi:hypothetical protein|nr:hypothetical protein [Deltaproteobacteria bacterium]
MRPDPYSLRQIDARPSTFLFVAVSPGTVMFWHFRWTLTLGERLNESGMLAARFSRGLVMAAAAVFYRHLLAAPSAAVPALEAAIRAMAEGNDRFLAPAADLPAALKLCLAVFLMSAFMHAARRLREYSRDSRVPVPVNMAAAFFFQGFHVYCPERKANALEAGRGADAFQPPFGQRQFGLRPPPGGDRRR